MTTARQVEQPTISVHPPVLSIIAKNKTPPVESKITGEVEAHVIAMAYHNPPEGYCRWTLRLLSERMVQMNYIDKIIHTTVGKILKENSLKPHLVEEWCIPKPQFGIRNSL